MKRDYDFIEEEKSKDGRIVCLNGKYGVINILGEEIIPPKYDWIHHVEDGYSVRINNRYGFCNIAGEEIVPCLYVYVRKINLKRGDQIFIVTNFKNEQKVLGKDGRVLIPFYYENIWEAADTGLLIAKKGTEEGVIDLNKKEIIPFRFLHIKYKEKHYCFEAETVANKKCIIDLKGNVIIPLDYYFINYYSNRIYVTKSGLLQIYEYDGKLVNTFSDYKQVFANGYIEIETPEGIGVMSPDGEIIINANNGYKHVRPLDDKGKFWEVSKDLINFSVTKEREDEIIEYFNQGSFLIQNNLIIVRDGKTRKSGIFDTQGNQIVDFKYDDISLFNKDGFAVIFSEGKFGVIDKKGKERIKPIYSKILELSKDNVKVLYQDRIGTVYYN